MKDFKDLKVWIKAHELTLGVYSITRSRFPKEEIYGLTSQVRRSASSIGTNIAEGCGRRSDRELHRFLQIARGSSSEVEYQLLLARDLHYIGDGEYQNLSGKLTEVQRMLTSFVQSLHVPAPTTSRQV